MVHNSPGARAYRQSKRHTPGRLQPARQGSSAKERMAANVKVWTAVIAAVSIWINPTWIELGDAAHSTGWIPRRADEVLDDARQSLAFLLSACCGCA